jgi:hypothetical protein
MTDTSRPSRLLRLAAAATLAADAVVAATAGHDYRHAATSGALAVVFALIGTGQGDQGPRRWIAYAFLLVGIVLVLLRIRP